MMMGVAQVIGMNPTLRSFFSGGGLREHLGRGPQREELRYCRQRRGGADGAQESPAAVILREQRAHYGRFDDSRQTSIRGCQHLGVVLGVAGVGAAAAAALAQSPTGVQRIVETHGPPPFNRIAATGASTCADRATNGSVNGSNRRASRTTAENPCQSNSFHVNGWDGDGIADNRGHGNCTA